VGVVVGGAVTSGSGVLVGTCVVDVAAGALGSVVPLGGVAHSVGATTAWLVDESAAPVCVAEVLTKPLALGAFPDGFDDDGFDDDGFDDDEFTELET
jgi:hypothetical protein